MTQTMKQRRREPPAGDDDEVIHGMGEPSYLCSLLHLDQTADAGIWVTPLYPTWHCLRYISHSILDNAEITFLKLVVRYNSRVHICICSMRYRVHTI